MSEATDRAGAASPVDTRFAAFASDNYAGVHPAILEAIVEANAGWAPAYGDDAWTAALDERFREVFGPRARAFPVFNGTGGNVTALGTLLRPWQAVVCAETAHINVDECGAPERFTGAKLIDVPTGEGKLTPQLVADAVTGIGDQHHVQAAAVSISQSTGARHRLHSGRDRRAGRRRPRRRAAASRRRRPAGERRRRAGRRAPRSRH